jgi:glycosyltransferase involved in cell wall biosynthesis
MRVLFVNDHLGYSGGVVHGGTTLFYSILPRLNRNGIDASLCILKPYHEAAEIFEQEGVSPIFLGRTKWDPRALFDLIQLVRELEVDIVHLHTMKAFLLGRIVAAVTGCRVVMHFHDTNRPSRPIGIVQRLLAPWVDVALSVAPHVKEMIIDAYNIPEEQIKVLPNAINLNRFKSSDSRLIGDLRTEWGADKLTPVIGVIGRLSEGKGQDLLMRSLPALLNRVSDVKIVIVGDGPKRGALELLSNNLDLTDNIHFTGHRSDIPVIVNAVDIVAHPSVLNEGFGLVLLEGMAAGKPVVAFDVGAASMLIDPHKNGMLISKGDMEGFTRNLERLVCSKELRVELGREAQKQAENYGLSMYVSKLSNIYQDVINCQK